MGEKVAFQIRSRYLGAFMKRKMKWIDGENLFKVAAELKENCLFIEKVVCDKVAVIYYLIGVMIAGPAIALCVRWTFALFMLGLVPFIVLVIIIFNNLIIMRDVDAKSQFQKAEAYIAEAVSMIKSIKMMGK